MFFKRWSLEIAYPLKMAHYIKYILYFRRAWEILGKFMDVMYGDKIIPQTNRKYFITKFCLTSQDNLFCMRIGHVCPILRNFKRLLANWYRESWRCVCGYVSSRISKPCNLNSLHARVIYKRHSYFSSEQCTCVLKRKI